MWALFVLGAIAATAERQTVAINDRTEMSVAFLPLVFSAVAFGPLGGFAVGALSTALDLPNITAQMERVHPDSWPHRRRGWTRGGEARPATEPPWPIPPGQPCWFSRVPRGRRVLQHGYRLRARQRCCRTSSCHCIAVVAHGAALRSGSDALRLRIPHLLAGARARLLRSDACCAKAAPPLPRGERDATSRLAAANDRLRRASLSFATALVATLDARDQYTAGHSAAVAIYARDIAQRMGLSQDSRNSSTSAASCTTLARSGFPLACSRSPGR